ncbi:MAG: nuclear transport factor 2 family protein [Microvirga sp.]
MPNTDDCLRRLYASFNKQDLDGVVSTLHPDVVWDSELEGMVRGRDGVRAYLERQWQHVRTFAEPLAYKSEPDDVVRVSVQLTLHDKDGNVLIDKSGAHLIQVIDGLVRRFDVGATDV